MNSSGINLQAPTEAGQAQTMATVNVTTNPPPSCLNCTSTEDRLHASARADADAQRNGARAADTADAANTEEEYCPFRVLEETIEEERTRLMLAESVLGCLQIALDPEAIKITPEPYFPEVLDLARQFINKSLRQLDRDEFRRRCMPRRGVADERPAIG